MAWLLHVGTQPAAEGVAEFASRSGPSTWAVHRSASAPLLSAAPRGLPGLRSRVPGFIRGFIDYTD